MLARRLPGILAPLTDGEALEVTRVHSVAGTLPAGAGLVRTPPFRAPHHGISAPGLVGGGARPVPGEMSLAHRGALFLDEIAEFRRDALEAIRQPLEERSITVVRVGGACVFPCDVLLVAAMNPCPCGFAGDPRRSCACDPRERSRYARKLSGPFLDRIDLHVVDAGPPVAGAPRRRRRRALRRDPRPRGGRPGVRCVTPAREGGLPQRGSLCTGACAALPPRRRGRSRSRDGRRAPPPVGAGDPSGPARRADDRRSRGERAGPFVTPVRSAVLSPVADLADFLPDRAGLTARERPIRSMATKSGARLRLQTLEPARAGVHGRGLRGSGKEETGEVQHDHFRAARAGAIPQAHDLLPFPRARRRFRRGRPSGRGRVRLGLSSRRPARTASTASPSPRTRACARRPPTSTSVSTASPSACPISRPAPVASRSWRA